MKSLRSQPESPEKADKERHKLRWIREHKLRSLPQRQHPWAPGFLKFEPEHLSVSVFIFLGRELDSSHHFQRSLQNPFPAYILAHAPLINPCSGPNICDSGTWEAEAGVSPHLRPESQGVPDQQRLHSMSLCPHNKGEAGVIVPRLKAHVAPAEDRFSPCHLHGNSQPTLTPGPGTLTPSSDLCSTKCVAHRHMRKQKSTCIKSN